VKDHSAKDVAGKLGISRATVYRLIHDGQLKTVTRPPKPGLAPRTRITDEDLQAFIKQASDA
jgi:excisionase family DNA binding protein